MSFQEFSRVFFFVGLHRLILKFIPMCRSRVLKYAPKRVMWRVCLPGVDSRCNTASTETGPLQWWAGQPRHGRSHCGSGPWERRHSRWEPAQLPAPVGSSALDTGHCRHVRPSARRRHRTACGRPQRKSPLAGDGRASEVTRHSTGASRRGGWTNRTPLKSSVTIKREKTA